MTNQQAYKLNAKLEEIQNECIRLESYRQQLDENYNQIYQEYLVRAIEKTDMDKKQMAYQKEKGKILRRYSKLQEQYNLINMRLVQSGYAVRYL